MRTTRHARVIAGICVVAGLAAACSSSGNSGSKSGGPSGQSSATSNGSSGSTGNTAASGPAIKIGIISTESSAGVDQSAVSKAAKIAVAAVNDSGGVKGRKLVLDSCNDQGSAQKAAQCAQQLLVTDKVVAIVGDFSLSGSASLYPLLKSQHSINFGVYPLSLDDATSPLSYTFTQGGFGLAALWTQMKPGSGNVVAFSYDGQQDFMNAVMKPSVQRLGYKLKVLTTPITTSDWSVLAQQIVALKPVYVVPSLAPSATPAAATALAQAGLKAPLLFPVGSVGSQAVAPLQSSGADVTVGSGYIADPNSTEYPAFGQFQADLKKYEGSVGKPNDTVSEGVINAWLAVKLFAKVAAEVPTVSADAIKAFMDKQSNFVTGLTHPLDFANPTGFPGFSRMVNTYMVPAKLDGSGVTTTSTTWKNGAASS